CGWSPSVRTLQRHFGRLELVTRPDGTPPEVFGRFECAAPNEMWTGDALHGPRIAGRKAYLFAFLDDHSRAVMAARWGYFEDTVRLAAALRPALAARGVPARIYTDNGSAFVDAAVNRAATRLGSEITHSPPGRPEGRVRLRPVRHVGAGGPLERAAARHRGAAGDRPSLPPEGETRGAGRSPAADRDRLPRPDPGRARGSRPPEPDPLRRPRRGRERPGRGHGGGRPVTAVPAAQVSAVLAWAARLSADPAAAAAETAAYLTAKAAVLARIAAARAAGVW